ncbi:MAG: hypothetical protein Q9218_002949 [Villophora microphyllina]
MASNPAVNQAMLPLPDAPAYIVGKPDVLESWNAINAFYNAAREEESSLTLYAGPILLACWCVRQGLTTEIEAEKTAPKGQSPATSVASRVGKAAQWLEQEKGVRGAMDRFKDIFHMAIMAAEDYYDMILPRALFEPAMTFTQQLTLPDPMGKLTRCLLMWQLIERATKGRSVPWTKTSQVKMRIKNLAKQIHVQLPDPGVAQKRPRAESGASGQALSPHPRHPPPSPLSTAQSIKAMLTFDQGEKAIISQYDLSHVVVPQSGLTACPAPVTRDNVRTLYGKQWLDGEVMYGYLALVCHEGNGLFDKDGMQPGSPKWHVWPTYWPQAPMSLSIDAFPSAKLGDIENHFFHRCVDQNTHWILLHLRKWSDKWTIWCYSTKEGYDKDIAREWRTIGSKLASLIPSFKLAEVVRGTPRHQPRQKNHDDCGVLVLGIARWIVDDLPLSTLVAEICPNLRQRMIMEIVRWRLHQLKDA